MNQLQAIFFDLDGTLLDTAPDMAEALLVLLAEENHPAPDYAAIRPHVSFGALGLLKMALGIDQQHPRYEQLRERYLTIYAENLCKQTRLFDGFDDLLARFDTLGIPWGIVTNKPEFLTLPLLKALNLATRSCATISGDTINARKPSPLPLFEACKRGAVDSSACVYVGDAERDIVAGNAANMTTVTALYGYIPEHEDPMAWPDNGKVNNASELWQFLQTQYANLR